MVLERLVAPGRKLGLPLMGVVAAMALTGCASTTPTREVTNGYAVFDIKVGPEVPASRLASAMKTSLQERMSGVRITNNIPPSPLPEKAARFKLESPFKGSGLAAIAAASGQSFQVPTCEGSILTAHAADSSMSKYGEGTTFFACLMPYQGGYSMNIYTTFTKASGGFSAEALGAALARSVVGDSSQFIPRTIKHVVDSIKATGANVTMVEAYP